MKTRLLLITPIVALLVTLSACGSLEVGVQSAAAPTTQYLALGPADFGCQCDYLTIGDRTSIAAIHLPQQAQITRITVYYGVSDATPAGFKVALQRIGSQVYESIAEMTVPGIDYQPLAAVPPRFMRIESPRAIIDNTSFIYRIAIVLADLTPRNNQPYSVSRVQVDYIVADTLAASPVPTSAEAAPIEVPTAEVPGMLPSPGPSVPTPGQPGGTGAYPPPGPSETADPASYGTETATASPTPTAGPSLTPTQPASPTPTDPASHATATATSPPTPMVGPSSTPTPTDVPPTPTP